MYKFLFSLSIFLITNANSAEPFKAEYKVFKAGKEIGKSSIELSQKDDKLTLIDKTNGTHGMASFLGFKRSETTLFDSVDGTLLPVSYKMNQKVAFNQRKSNFKVENESIEGKHKDKSFSLITPDNSFTTPNLVKLNLANDICNGKTESLSYQVIDSGKLKTYKFEIASVKENIVEVNKVHTKPHRITKTWLDSERQCLPVKTYHSEKDEDILETKIINFNLS